VQSLDLTVHAAHQHRCRMPGVYVAQCIRRRIENAPEQSRKPLAGRALAQHPVDLFAGAFMLDGC